MADVADDLEDLLRTHRNLTAHDESSPLPCLCKGCLNPSLEAAETQGAKFVRGHAVADGRILLYWVPEELAGERDGVANSVHESMKRRLRK